MLPKKKVLFFRVVFLKSSIRLGEHRVANQDTCAAVPSAQQRDDDDHDVAQGDASTTTVVIVTEVVA